MAKLIYVGSKANLPESASRESAFYLVSDTREVYFGANLYTESVRFFTSTELAPKPANPAQGVLYVDTVTGNGYTHNGTAWQNVFTGTAGIEAALIGESTDDKDADTIYGAKAYADDAVATAKTDLIGDPASDDKDDDTIEGAKRYADDVKTTLEGNASTDTYSSTTIAGAKKYADKVGSDLLGTAQDTSSDETVRGARALANTKVASITAGDGIEVDTASPNSTTAPEVSVKLSAKTGNSLGFESGTGEEGLYAHVPTVSVVKKSTANDDYAASYQVTVDGTAVGADINIPKDYLVKSATVDTVVAADKASGGKFEDNSGFSVGDKYLDFVVNTKADGDGTAETDAHIYLNVKDLAHIYTEGNGIDISESDVVSVVIDSSNANGLSVGANGIALACATATNGNTPATAGAMSGTDKDHLDAAYEAVQTGTF